MKIIDLFCGAGGLSLGFEQSGFKVISAIDNCKSSIETFNKNHPEKPGKCIEVSEFNKKELSRILVNEKITGVIGGPPCQGFSSARLSDYKNEITKLNEKRNKLYIDFFNCVKISKPDFFLIENVKGMAKLNDGAFLKDIEQRFGKLGYSIYPSILNASEYGVPQRRERVFIVGMLKEGFVFPQKDFELISSSDAISDLPSKPSNEYVSKLRSNPKNDYQKRLRGNITCVYNHQVTNHTEQTINIISQVPDGGNIKSLPEKYWKVRRFNKAFQRMNSKEPSLTIDTGHRNYFHYKENRIPTVRECARLQSFPDSFKFKGNKSEQYRQVGNAVPPILSFKIASEIKKVLLNSNL